MADTRTITTVKQPYYTSDGTKLFLGTSTEVQVDKNGKYIPNSAVISLRLYDTTSSLLGTDYKTIAIRNAGEAWRFTQDASGAYVAGADVQKTLTNKNSMMNINLNNHISNALSAPLQGVPAGQVNTNTKSNSNSATGLPETAADPPSTSTPVTEPFNLGGGLSKTSKSRNTYGKYHYPEAIAKNTQDRIKFSMKPVIGGTINPKLGEKTFTKRYGGSIGEVTLPIQPNIMDSNTVDWSGTPMNALLGYGAAQSMSLASSKDPQEFLDKAGQGITEIVKAIQDPKYRTLTNIALAQEAIGLQGLLSRATGAALNPNLELLFNGPQLRSFDFNFTMSPRSSKEATQVRNIIRFFKQGMSVKTTDSNVFLKSPHVFDIRYITYDRERKQIDHPSINRIKTCALIGCDVNYTPDGNYMTYNEPGVNPMTSYQMTLRFSEIDPIYDEDYSYTDSEGKTTNQYNIGINDIGF